MRCNMKLKEMIIKVKEYANNTNEGRAMKRAIRIGVLAIALELVAYVMSDPRYLALLPIAAGIEKYLRDMYNASKCKE